MTTIVYDCPVDDAYDLPMPSVVDHLIQIILILAVIASFDTVVRYYTWTSAGARWFFLHSVANWAIAAMSLEDLIYVTKHPLCAMLAPVATWKPSQLAFALHVYHLLAFTKLRAEDIRHHVLFCGFFGVFNFTMDWGPVQNTLLFFISGLPGAMDYILLAAVKEGKFDTMREKYINSNINVWLRMPGLVFTGVVLWSCGAMGQIKSPYMWIPSIVCTILAIGNGVHYMAQIHENYHRKDAEVVFSRTRHPTLWKTGRPGNDEKDIK